MNKDDSIYVTGHRGFVGRNLVKRLEELGYTNIYTTTRKEVDLRNDEQVSNYFFSVKPKYVFMCAARVGGIGASMADPFGFIYDNLVIQNNLIGACLDFKVSKAMFLGSSCIYPKDYTQPLKEEYILRAPLEPTNEGYGLAKLAGLKMCEYANATLGSNFISLMPCNLYGPGDCYDPKRSHVLAALIKKVVEAKERNQKMVEVWGTGYQAREFLFIDDIVDGMIWSMQNLDKTDTFLNMGSGNDITIRELAYLIKDIVEYDGDFFFNMEKPDGMQRKCLDVTKLKRLGWQAKTDMECGIEMAVDSFIDDSQGERSCFMD